MKNFRENLMHAVFFVCALTSIAAVVRRIKVDLPQPGPPLRMIRS